MLIRKLVVVGLVGVVSLAASIATAEDAVAPSTAIAVDGVSFADSAGVFGQDRFRLDLGFGQDNRFSALGLGGRKERNRGENRDFEVALTARGAAGFDLSLAQRGGYDFNGEGEVERERRASELRMGRGLRDMPRDRPSSTPRWYVFAASEDEALVWQPGARSEFGGAGNSFALQDRVEVGDVQAGVTYEHHGFQTSLAYVERELNVYSGARSFSQDENFAGLTLTYRH